MIKKTPWLVRPKLAGYYWLAGRAVVCRDELVDVFGEVPDRMRLVVSDHPVRGYTLIYIKLQRETGVVYWCPEGVSYENAGCLSDEGDRWLIENKFAKEPWFVPIWVKIEGAK